MGSSSRMKQHHDRTIANAAAKAASDKPQVTQSKEVGEIEEDFLGCDHVYVGQEESEAIKCRKCGHVLEDDE